MVIAIEAQRLFRRKKHGMDMVALEMIRALASVDRSNQYIVFVNKGPDRCIVSEGNIRVVKFGGWYPMWEQILLPLYCVLYKVDVLHCTSNLAPVFPTVPLMVTVHDVIYLEGGAFFKKGYTPYQRFGNLYRRIIAPFVLSKAKLIVTVSESEKELLLKQPRVVAGKVVVVFNGVGEHFMREGVSDAELKVTIENLDLPDSYIFHFGNTDPKKNTPGTIRAYLRYLHLTANPLKMVVADFGYDQLYDILRAANQTEQLEQFIMPGYIKNQDMPAVFRSASVFLYTGIRESFGIPILEAMASSVPVVTSNLYSMPEVAGDAALLVDPYDEAEIAGAILEATENSTLRKKLIRAGNLRARQFSWKNSANELLPLYSLVSN